MAVVAERSGLPSTFLVSKASSVLLSSRDAVEGEPTYLCFSSSVLPTPQAPHCVVEETMKMSPPTQYVDVGRVMTLTSRTRRKSATTR